MHEINVDIKMIDPKIMTNDPNIINHKLTSDQKIMQNKATSSKITGPKGIFRENWDGHHAWNHLLTISPLC